MKWFVLYRFKSDRCGRGWGGEKFGAKKPSSGAKAHSLRTFYAGAEAPAF
jgi:hypothetical protein